ncbi:MAG: hypothetical protein A2233_00565 [Candidatus Kerfeldbacteria bacterium RIFOXYA2_FULL_38_24]|uniref:Uncharacterized protein n=1 Tax=Candidatus Kerfeldbacteria bacterium RIFOXYB2_FULL_38_14 TaxID=1798547 RepID=A0A1G2BBZ8_9BACT|nr:MAG: hypothetical protein A2233_00565 [Candidatus Kerfeldbacteria bacterium RIFOXYA2_FULL_38_24]OGY86652.1 MAG: hypothetical protein A2319_02855 [Candidatus Kerfeldbacteria bacterium RIFOXYB2_FULL_38_14]OGY88538.1 MAG: hypothetical protein A2458_05305 [Candidatus Kerfeldbacteria bacterium RIFOXYC2_FULL_38_9]
MTYLKLITPINIGEEKEKFFASKTYNPQLRYHWDRKTLDSIKKRHPELICLANALFEQNNAQIVDAASKYFEVNFRDEDIAKAQSIISAIPKIQNGNAQQLAEKIRSYLIALNIPYIVEIVDRYGFQCRPQHNKQKLLLSKHVNLQFLSVVSVAMHEMVHIVRAVNGNANKIKPQSGYLPTEEGLACLMQDEHSGNGAGSPFQHALEYLGAHMSLTHGFRDIYDFFRTHGLNEDVAWQRAIRQKFGLQDTQQPGGLCKSGMYFYHEQLLSSFSKEQLLNLFVGKIRADQIEDYAVTTSKISNETLSSFFAF